MALWTRSRRNQGDPSPAGIVADVSGDVGGQLAVGNHIVQVSAQHGAIVNLASPQQLPAVRPRSEPAAIKPRPLPGLLGRDAEQALLRSALAGGLPSEVHGLPGVGKTALLRALCHDATCTPAHGVVYLRTAGQTTEDVGQQLFEALCTSDAPFKPTPVQLCTHLRDRSALVVLDDVEWGRDAVAQLMDWAPSCLFLLASERRLLWGDGRSHALAGLEADAALALLERELGRAFDAAERDRALELCHLLDGRPLALLQAATLARDGELPLASAEQLEQQVRATLTPSEQRLLEVLEALRPAAVHVDDAGAIAGVSGASDALERLRAAGAAQSNSPRWNVTLSVTGGAAADGELAARAVRQLAGPHGRPAADVPPLIAALAACAAAGRWRELTAAVREADALLTFSGHWGAWQIALEHARKGAESCEDAAAEAWTLHQLGTRAGCLGDVETARPLLERALDQRKQLGDAAGARVTAHNLAVFGGSAGDDGGGEPVSADPDRPRGRTAALVGVGVALLLAGGTAAALVASNDGGDPGGENAVPITATQSNERTTTRRDPTTDPARPVDPGSPGSSSSSGSNSGTRSRPVIDPPPPVEPPVEPPPVEPPPPEPPRPPPPPPPPPDEGPIVR